MTRSRAARLAAAWALALGLALGLAPGGAEVLAQGAPATAASADRLRGEIARLRGELDRTNAEIGALKRGARGVRDDYRLRNRMADAEALARRLTSAEAELRRIESGPAARPAPAPAVVVAAEAPGVLEAKADILDDQARRMAAQAGAFARAAAQVRNRQVLRRRANQLERDPFAGFDAAKRTMVVEGGRTTVEPPPVGGRTRGGTPADQGSAFVAGSADRTATAAPPAPSGGAVAPAPGAPAPAPPPPPPPPATPTVAPETTQTPPAGPTAPSATPLAPAPAPTSTVTPQLRAFLDPATAAELKRLESGAAASDPAALERAAALLRARASQLGAQAEQLRARARAR
jgi:hypothetical protein